MEFQNFVFVSLCYWASCALKLQDCPLSELLAAWACQSHPERRLRRLRFHQVPILPWDILMIFDEQQMSALLATADFGLGYFWRCHCFCDWGALEGGVLRLNVCAMCRTRCWRSIECEKGGSRIGPQGLRLNAAMIAAIRSFTLLRNHEKTVVPLELTSCIAAPTGATSLLNLCLGVVSKLVKVYATKLRRHLHH